MVIHKSRGDTTYAKNFPVKGVNNKTKAKAKFLFNINLYNKQDERKQDYFNILFRIREDDTTHFSVDTSYSIIFTLVSGQKFMLKQYELTPNQIYRGESELNIQAYIDTAVFRQMSAGVLSTLSLICRKSERVYTFNKANAEKFKEEISLMQEWVNLKKRHEAHLVSEAEFSEFIKKYMIINDHPRF